MHHTLSVNFIRFTAELYNALPMQGKKATLASWGRAWPLWLPKVGVRVCVRVKVFKKFVTVTNTKN